MKNAYAGGDPYYEQRVQNVAQQMMNEPTFYQSAYTAASDGWASFVEGIGEAVGYEWIVFAALIGMPVTVTYVVKKIIKILKS